MKTKTKTQKLKVLKTRKPSILLQNFQRLETDYKYIIDANNKLHRSIGELDYRTREYSRKLIELSKQKDNFIAVISGLGELILFQKSKIPVAREESHNYAVMKPKIQKKED